MWNKSSESGKHSIWCIWLGRDIIRLWLHLVVDIIVPSVNVCGDKWSDRDLSTKQIHLNALCQTGACMRGVWLQRKFRISKQLWHSWAVNPSFETCFSTEKHTHAARRWSEILRSLVGRAACVFPFLTPQRNILKVPHFPRLTRCLCGEKKDMQRSSRICAMWACSTPETWYRGWCNRCRIT